MNITDKTVARIITIIVVSMLVVSIITTGFNGKMSLVLYGALIMALFYDDLASWEFKERNDKGNDRRRNFKSGKTFNRQN